ncbi:MAG: XRE family transcriptional regulator [Lysobacterales bacterium]|nr:MAG: XRE family transcriptional regulator [Xanthomonadales bacterium]
MGKTTGITDRFAENLRNTRKSRGWTYSYASQKLGCHIQSWMKWESGERVPALADIERIAECLGCSTQRLLR